MAGAETVQVEIAWPDGADYRVVMVELAAGATVRGALVAGGFGEWAGALGVFGEPVETDSSLRDGDRLELYAPLRVDPKTARRRRAAAAEKNRAGG
ncbi:MAG: RnfH family protein [Immundisolibacter sp.]|uniref:RnfH family protein n=1 Tax=Immundisolibacter sp. TaxID=1934948 RepID=UPI003D0AB663